MERRSRCASGAIPTDHLFWHSLGPGSHGATFAVAAVPLAAAGFRVVALDAPGLGRSGALEPDRYAVDRLAELLWRVADAVGVGRAVVAGHSWGGTVSVVAAAMRPERTAALVLYDSGHADFADMPNADVTATRDQFVAAAKEDSGVDSWDELVALLRAERLDQPWTLEAWREATVEQPDGSVRLRSDPVARGAAMFEAMRARPSAHWAAIDRAATPILLVLATEPPEVAETNERLLPRFLAAVPRAEVGRPGCRHQVFADLGHRAGDLAGDWLRSRDVA